MKIVKQLRFEALPRHVSLAVGRQQDWLEIAVSWPEIPPLTLYLPAYVRTIPYWNRYGLPDENIRVAKAVSAVRNVRKVREVHKSPIEVSSLILFPHFPHFPQAIRTIGD